MTQSMEDPVFKEQLSLRVGEHSMGRFNAENSATRLQNKVDKTRIFLLTHDKNRITRLLTCLIIN